jgi:hypothetical protein
MFFVEILFDIYAVILFGIPIDAFIWKYPATQMLSISEIDAPATREPKKFVGHPAFTGFSLVKTGKKIVRSRINVTRKLPTPE